MVFVDTEYKLYTFDKKEAPIPIKEDWGFQRIPIFSNSRVGVRRQTDS